MKPCTNEAILHSIADILKHIQTVQADVKTLSELSAIHFHNLVTNNAIEVDEKTLTAFQYQDIITQQLCAANEAIAGIEKNIETYIKAAKHDQDASGENLKKLATELTELLKTAKEKQNAFIGNAIDVKHVEAIEFF